MQKRERNVQKSVMHVRSCRFANQTYCFFDALVVVAVRRLRYIQDSDKTTFPAFVARGSYRPKQYGEKGDGGGVYLKGRSCQLQIEN